MFGKMRNRWRAALSLACVGLAAGLLSAASGQTIGPPDEGGPPPGVDPYIPADRIVGQGGWVAQFPRDDVWLTLQDVDLVTIGDRMYAGTPKPERVRTAVLEIRTADNAHRVLSIAVPADNASSLFSTGTTQMLFTFHLRDYPSVPAGQYVAAFIVNDQRRSNVIRLTIDPHKDLSKLPRVRIAQMEPQKAGSLPDVVAYVSRALESDPAPDEITLASGQLVIDGTAIRRTGMAYEGGNGPLSVGGTLSYPMSWEQSTPDLTKPHTVAVRIANQAMGGARNRQNAPSQDSAPQPLESGTPLADAWDKATAALAPAPAAQPVLRGSILAPRKPSPRAGQAGDMPIFEITLAGKDTLCMELSDWTGTYDFRNLPPGPGTLTCTPRGQKFPLLTIDNVKLDAKAVPTLDLPLTPTVEISGRVAHADGSPADKISIYATWVSDDGHMTYQSLALTGADGTYALRSPFAKNSIISYLDGANEIRIAQNKSGPAKDVNFTLTK